MVIRNNMASVSAHISLKKNNDSLTKQLKRLSTGYALNSAADNAARLAISVSMRARIGKLSQTADNAQDGISLLQTAEGALGETHSLLEVMSKMSVLAANASYSDKVDRAAMQLQFEKMMEEIDDIAGTSDFNGIEFFDKDIENSIALHLSTDTTDGEDYEITFGKMDSKSLGIDGCSVDTQENANKSIDKIRDAINLVSDERTKYGAFERRIEHRFNLINIENENLNASESRITDANMAEEFMRYTKFEILTDSSQAMLAQANTQPAGVLKLLTPSQTGSSASKKSTHSAKSDNTEKSNSTE